MIVTTRYMDTVLREIGKKLDGGSGIQLTQMQAMMPVSSSWYYLAYGKGKFVVTTLSNVVACSADGINWSTSTMPSSNLWPSVTYGNGKFVAVANNSNVAAYSEDGISWAAATLPDSLAWMSVAYGNGKFVAVAEGTNIAAYSEDGVNWTQTAMPRSENWLTVTYGGGKFVAVGQNTSAAYSEDGINWNSSNAFPNPILNDESFYAVTYGGNKFVALSYDFANRIFYSEDGVNWSAASGSGNSWSDVAYGNGKFVAVSNRTSNNSILYSEDGIVWYTASLPNDIRCTSIIYGDDKFVIIDAEGTSILYSHDGVTWYDGAKCISQNNINVTTDILSALKHTHDDYAIAEHIHDDLQPKITGAQGQMIGFDASGNAVAQDLPSSMPEVTTVDNGKFLRVVNGAWAATTVLNAEEVAF